MDPGVRSFYNVLKRAARRCTPSVSLICFGLLQIELNGWFRRLGA